MPPDSRSSSSTDHLDVYYDTTLLGFLFDTDPMSFEYSTRWLEKAEAFALPGIPLGAERRATQAVAAVFDNLLPEGALRDYIGKQRHVSTLFALLREVAGDTAGGLLILKAGAVPMEPAYRKTSWAELAAHLKGKRTPGIDIRAKDARISLSGAQDKILIAIDEDGRPMLPLGESPSTHIVKPDIRQLTKVHHSALNETVVMLTAAKAGLEMAEVFYEPTTAACIVKRFDRLQQAGRLTRLLQYDLCQLHGSIAERKYESEGGPGIVRCAQLIREYSAQPAVDLLRLLEWVFFNLYVGNNDSHAKNLSVHSRPGTGVVLTPFYDLMCTRVYPGLSGKFALSIAGENHPGRIGREHVAQMAGELNFRPAYVLDIAEQVAAKVLPAMEAAVSTIEPVLSNAGKILVQKVLWKVSRITQQAAARILKLPRK